MRTLKMNLTAETAEIAEGKRNFTGGVEGIELKLR
jgi:hypothetical protein